MDAEKLAREWLSKWHSHEDGAATLAALLRRIREEAVEECARVADLEAADARSEARDLGGVFDHAMTAVLATGETAERIAERIRSLSTKSKGEDQIRGLR